MKKVLSILLSVAMIVLCFAACGKTDGDKSSTGKAANVKVGFIFLHDENSTYDKNFITAAEEACKKAGVEILKKTNISETQACYDAAAELVDEGCNVIFADSFGHEPYIIQAAKKFPEVQFLHATGTKAHTEGLSNYHNAFASIYAVSYTHLTLPTSETV